MVCCGAIDKKCLQEFEKNSYGSLAARMIELETPLSIAWAAPANNEKIRWSPVARLSACCTVRERFECAGNGCVCVCATAGVGLGRRCRAVLLCARRAAAASGIRSEEVATRRPGCAASGTTLPVPAPKQVPPLRGGGSARSVSLVALFVASASPSARASAFVTPVRSPR